MLQQRCVPTATAVNGNGYFNKTGMAVAPVLVAASASQPLQLPLISNPQPFPPETVAVLEKNSTVFNSNGTVFM